jgi:hypothetical protein
MFRKAQKRSVLPVFFIGKLNCASVYAGVIFSHQKDQHGCADADLVSVLQLRLLVDRDSID